MFGLSLFQQTKSRDKEFEKLIKETQNPTVVDLLNYTDPLINSCRNNQQQATNM